MRVDEAVGLDGETSDGDKGGDESHDSPFDGKLANLDLEGWARGGVVDRGDTTASDDGEGGQQGAAA